MTTKIKGVRKFLATLIAGGALTGVGGGAVIAGSDGGDVAAALGPATTVILVGLGAQAATDRRDAEATERGGHPHDESG